jgi:hypothetical protein
VDAKFGSVGAGWCSLNPIGAHEVGLWKNIRRGGACSVGMPDLSWEMGLGSDSGMMCGVESYLSKKRSRSYMALLVRRMHLLQIILTTLVAFFNGMLALFVWLMIGSWTVASFFTLLYSLRGRKEVGRQALVDLLLQGKFDVRSFYRVLARNDARPFPWKSIWRTKAPVKVAFFAWSAALEKILTLDNLRQRHVIVINRCCMCKRH